MHSPTLCGLQTVNCGLCAVHLLYVVCTVECVLWTVDCGLWTVDCLGPLAARYNVVLTSFLSSFLSFIPP